MERLLLTPRLAALAELVPQQAMLADVGTDHGKLPLFLLKEHQIKSAIGSDIHKGPLAHAAQNAAAHGVSDCISLRLGAGLAPIEPSECDTVSIAGMGGTTIIDILAAAPWTADGRHLLLLQPMTMIPPLRQWLWAQGYRIEREQICREERRLYVILCVRGGGMPQHLPLSDCVVSEALCQAAGAKEYLEYLLRVETRALMGMERGACVPPQQLQMQRQTIATLKRAWEEQK